MMSKALGQVFRKMATTPSVRRLGAALLAGIVLAGCSLMDPETSYPGISRKTNGVRGVESGEEQAVFGPEGLSLAALGAGNQPQQDTGGSGGIGVNSFLWRASLDTVSFMPLLSADPFGGVIITDWYSPPESPGERFKLNIYILGRE